MSPVVCCWLAQHSHAGGDAQKAFKLLVATHVFRFERMEVPVSECEDRKIISTYLLEFTSSVNNGFLFAIRVNSSVIMFLI